MDIQQHLRGRDPAFDVADIPVPSFEDLHETLKRVRHSAPGPDRLQAWMVSVQPLRVLHSLLKHLMAGHFAPCSLNDSMLAFLSRALSRWMLMNAFGHPRNSAP
eukprot:2909419-Pyramimonas_sp.AAC.1